MDVNLQHLGIARQRYFHLGPRLELFCAEAEKFRARPGAFDLVHVPLLFEYVFPEVLVRRDRGVARGGVRAARRSSSFRAATARSRPRRRCGSSRRAKRRVPPEELEQLFEHYGMPLRRERTVPLPYGRSFWVGSFARPLK